MYICMQLKRMCGGDLGALLEGVVGRKVGYDVMRGQEGIVSEV